MEDKHAHGSVWMDILSKRSGRNIHLSVCHFAYVSRHQLFASYAFRLNPPVIATDCAVLQIFVRKLNARKNRKARKFKKKV